MPCHRWAMGSNTLTLGGKEEGVVVKSKASTSHFPKISTCILPHSSPAQSVFFYPPFHHSLLSNIISIILFYFFSLPLTYTFSPFNVFSSFSFLQLHLHSPQCSTGFYYVFKNLFISLIYWIFNDTLLILFLTFLWLFHIAF